MVGRRVCAQTLRREMNQIFAYTLVLVIGSGFAFGIHGCSEKTGKNVESAKWMPSGASDGAFYHGPTFILGPPSYYYEFTISEQDFSDYMVEKEKPIAEITSPIYATRYLERTVRREDYTVETNFDYERYKQAIGVTIKDGLVWEHRFEDSGAIYAFDRSQRRAFVEIWTR